MRYEFAEEGIHFSVACPSAVASRIWKKPIMGPVHEELEAPEDVIPAEEAARIILDINEMEENSKRREQFYTLNFDQKSE